MFERYRKRRAIGGRKEERVGGWGAWLGAREVKWLFRSSAGVRKASTKGERAT